MGVKKLDYLSRLIVVDDEIDMLDLYKHFFRREALSGGFDLLCFTSGEDCLAYIQKNNLSSGTTLIISDINMPKMSGFELLSKIKEVDPELSVWMASAYSAEEYKEAALKKGAEGYFEKPINFRDLKAAIALKMK